MALKRFYIWMALLASVMSISAQSYKVNGKAPGLDGQKVYLIDDQKVNFDSATVKDGVFSMEGKLTRIGPTTVKIGTGREMFLLCEVPVTVNVKADTTHIGEKVLTMPKVSVTGDQDQKLFKEMTKTQSAEMLMMMAIAFLGEKDTLARDSLVDLYVQAKAEHKAFNDSVVEHFTDSYVSALVLLEQHAKEMSAQEFQPYYDRLSNRVKNSLLGKEIASKIEQLKSIGEGAEAPDFEVPTPDGKTLSLSSLKGKYKCLLIDFWASWCGPCLREAPNIQAVYKDYHDKGFEVLSVSIDDSKEKWLDAIEKHQLNWLHVSDLGGWKSVVAKRYNVSAVPAMFLLDRNGVIVSTNARGEKLREMVEELVK